MLRWLHSIAIGSTGLAAVVAALLFRDPAVPYRLRYRLAWGSRAEPRFRISMRAHMGVSREEGQ